MRSRTWPWARELWPWMASVLAVVAEQPQHPGGAQRGVEGERVLAAEDVDAGLEDPAVQGEGLGEVALQAQGDGEVAADGEGPGDVLAAELLGGARGRVLEQGAGLGVAAEGHEGAAEAVLGADQLDGPHAGRALEPLEHLAADQFRLRVPAHPAQHVGELVDGDEDGAVGVARGGPPVLDRLLAEPPALLVLAAGPQVLDAVEDEFAGVVVGGVEGAGGFQVRYEGGVAGPVAG